MTDPLDPVGSIHYLIDRIVPWQIQLGCLAVVVIGGVCLWILLR